MFTKMSRELENSKSKYCEDSRYELGGYTTETDFIG